MKVGKKENEKIECSVKHPDKEEVVEFSKIKLLRNDKTKVVGIWVSVDEDENIQKGSALSELLKIATAETINELVGKELPTIEEGKDSSYLCIKGY